MNNELQELSAILGKDIEELYSIIRQQIFFEVCYKELPICRVLQLLNQIRIQDQDLFNAAMLILANPLMSFRQIAASCNSSPVTIWRKVKRLSAAYPEINTLLMLRNINRRQNRVNGKFSNFT